MTLMTYVKVNHGDTPTLQTERENVNEREQLIVREA